MTDTELSDEEIALIMGGNRGDTRMPPHPVLSTATPRPSFDARNGHPINVFGAMSGGGMILLFGDTGSGKTKTATTLALDALSEARRVVYYDVERNIHGQVMDLLLRAGCDYRQPASLREIGDSLKTLDTDMLVLDSATLEITGRWFSARTDERGKLLLEVQNLYYKLSEWCKRVPGRIVLGIAQPVSDFNDRALEPMSDKGNFYFKEAYYIVFRRDRTALRVECRNLVVFKSRSFAEGTLICPLVTTAEGVTFGAWGPEIRRFCGL